MLAIRAFRKVLSTEDVIATLDLAVIRPGAPPRYLITDRGSQFFNSKAKKPSAALQAWLDRCSVKPHFGAVGQKDSIPVMDRFWRTLKQVDVLVGWYNLKHPHSSPGAATPSESHARIPPPTHQPRYEVRPRFPVTPAGSESEKIWRTNLVKLDARHFKRRKHLPDVSLDVAA